MNVTNIIKIATEIKELRDRADELERQLAAEINQAKSIFPTDFMKKQEKHSDKFKPKPFTISAPLEPYWLGGYPTVMSNQIVR